MSHLVNTCTVVMFCGGGPVSDLLSTCTEIMFNRGRLMTMLFADNSRFTRSHSAEINSSNFIRFPRPHAQ